MRTWIGNSLLPITVKVVACLLRTNLSLRLYIGIKRKREMDQVEGREQFRALNKLIRDCEKYVKGRQYCYLMSREKGKVRFEYKGKMLGKDIKHYDEVKRGRARYRNLLSEVKRRVAFIKKILRDKELRAV